MDHRRIGFIAIMMFISMHTATRADESDKTFIPLSTSNKIIQSTKGSQSLSSLPHFFPLRSQVAGKFIPHNTNAAPRPEDIPVPHEGAPESMTKEQAVQILSIFAGGE